MLHERSVFGRSIKSLYKVERKNVLYDCRDMSRKLFIKKYFCENFFLLFTVFDEFWFVLSVFYSTHINQKRLKMHFFEKHKRCEKIKDPEIIEISVERQRIF